MAMEARCYRGGEGRTRMKAIKVTIRDMIAFCSIYITIYGVLLVSNYYSVNVEEYK